MPLYGVLPALVTPFNRDDGLVNHAALRELVDRVITDGASGVVACGSTGEFPAMTTAERKAVLETVADQASDRATVVAHVGSCSTAEAIELARHADASGADSLLVAPPFYGPQSQDSVFGYFADIAAATDLPICAYHYPAASGFDGGLEFMLRLAREIDSIDSFKDSTGDLDLLVRATQDHADEIQFVCGEELLFLPALTFGAKAFIMGSGNLLTSGFVELQRSFESGDLLRAVAVNAELLPAMRRIVVGPYAGLIKAAMNEVGLEAGGVRRPQLEPSPAATAELRTMLSSLDPALWTLGDQTK